MNASTEIFVLLCGVFALGGALATVLAKSPLRAAMGLLLNIVSLAGLFLALHAQLLAVIQLIVYAGAVVVLFVFVIMLIGPSATVGHDARGLLARTVGLASMAIVTGGLLFVARRFVLPPAQVPTCAPGQADCVPFGGVEAVARALYVDAALPFELLSVALLVAVVGAVAVARGRSAAEAEAARRLQAEREARAAKKREQEERLSAEVAAHGGH
ncbi:MAG: NADH-quinone oxidoreductase subunit J [Myxococcota bacterium]